MEIQYSEKAIKQIKKIHKGDRKNLEMILKAIESYAENPSGKFDIKMLKGKYGDFKRLRAGDYRVIFEDTGNVIFIYDIKHRQEAYHD
jgi:addiction module RelE/StbE family toxin